MFTKVSFALKDPIVDNHRNDHSNHNRRYHQYPVPFVKPKNHLTNKSKDQHQKHNDDLRNFHSQGKFQERQHFIAVIDHFVVRSKSKTVDQSEENRYNIEKT